MTIKKLQQKKYSKGLSLIELLVSLAISVIIINGVFKIYANSVQNARVQDAIARIQENGRFALDILARDIRMAGYSGCNGTIDNSNIVNTLNGAPPSFDPGKGVQGWEAANTALGQVNNSVENLALENTSSGSWSTTGGNILDAIIASPNSDIVRIWGSRGQGVSISQILGNGAMTQVETELTSQFVDGDILLVSDCNFANWIQACNVQDIGGGSGTRLTLSNGCDPGNDVNLPLNINESGGEVVLLTSTMYYVSKRDDNSNNPPALYRQTLQGNGAVMGQPREIIEGVESLQILYGEDLDDDSSSAADTYVPANQVTDWEQVVGIRVELLLQSLEDNLSSNTGTYNFHGITYGEGGAGDAPEDNRLRRVFTTTINLRNRMLGI